MKYKFKNEYFRRNGRNKKMALNTWAVSILMYGAGMLQQNENEKHKKDERPGNFCQGIKNCTQEVMLHGCMFLGKMGEEDFFNVKIK